MPNLGTGTPPTPNATRTHKRVCWSLPADHKKRPAVLKAISDEMVRGLEQRRGSVWMRVRHAVSIAAYPIARALHRVRGLRGDGAESLLAMVVALIFLADLRTGFVGKPRPGGGPWQRYTLADLAELAYKSQKPADLRRARRALDMMISLGWASPTKQVRRYAGDDTFTSEPGVRFINFKRLCEMTGTTWLLKRDRQHADRTRGPGTASFQDARKRRQKPQHAPRGILPGRTTQERPRATGDPPGRTDGAQHIAGILELLAKG